MLVKSLGSDQKIYSKIEFHVNKDENNVVVSVVREVSEDASLLEKETSKLGIKDVITDEGAVFLFSKLSTYQFQACYYEPMNVVHVQALGPAMNRPYGVSFDFRAEDLPNITDFLISVQAVKTKDIFEEQKKKFEEKKKFLNSFQTNNPFLS